MSENATRKYRRLRINLIERGFTIRSWAQSRGYKPSTVYDAAKGARMGIKSVKICRELEEFSNAQLT